MRPATAPTPCARRGRWTQGSQERRRSSRYSKMYHAVVAMGTRLLRSRPRAFYPCNPTTASTRGAALRASAPRQGAIGAHAAAHIAARSLSADGEVLRLEVLLDAL